VISVDPNTHPFTIPEFATYDSWEEDSENEPREGQELNVRDMLIHRDAIDIQAPQALVSENFVFFPWENTSPVCWRPRDICLQKSVEGSEAGEQDLYSAEIILDPGLL
jgi:hypothetical protein